MVKVAVIAESEKEQLELKSYLNNQQGLKCFCTGALVAEVPAMVNKYGGLHVIVICINSDAVSKFSPVQLRKIKGMYPETEIMILADSTDTKKVITWLRAGVVGYLSKHTPLSQLTEAIMGIRQGGAYIMPIMVRKMLDFFRSQGDFEEVLTEREKEIVQCLVDGMSYKMIAHKLDVALDTVRYHLRNIYKKLKVNSKTQVISKAITGEIKV